MSKPINHSDPKVHWGDSSHSIKVGRNRKSHLETIPEEEEKKDLPPPSDPVNIPGSEKKRVYHLPDPLSHPLNLRQIFERARRKKQEKTESS